MTDWASKPSSTPNTLVDCAYIMWDYSELTDERLAGLLMRMEESDLGWGSYQTSSQTEEIVRSQNQRLGIYVRGGRGYWPTTGIDFSRITGLMDQDKEELIIEWKKHGWVDSRKRRRGCSSSSG
ncbi:hypothetical protein IL306_011702 [Fusarium sp. DS 682]|nr:hypothetical protein IL306_011702 [Fusarium sp. DS 682]